MSWMSSAFCRSLSYREDSMRIDIVTLFPEMFAPMRESILGRAQKQNRLQINVVNLRDYSEDRHMKCDDYPFGGGAGMVMMAQPIGSCIDALDPGHEAWRIYMSPKGRVFRQETVFELLGHERLLLLCGHYEGVDQRAIDLFIDEEMSIGDYVLTGGELPAMVITDCVARYVEGVISTSSLVDESFSDGLLEYPQYTRPVEYRGMSVPEVLRSGNHAKIDEWRHEQALEITKKQRPDLLAPPKDRQDGEPDSENG